MGKVRVRMRRLLLRHAADVIYDEPRSRTADHVLNTAYFGCSHDPLTAALGTIPADPDIQLERHAAQTNCTCIRSVAPLWWVGPLPRPRRQKPGHVQQRWPSQVNLCRCTHCFARCDAGAQAEP